MPTPRGASNRYIYEKKIPFVMCQADVAKLKKNKAPYKQRILNIATIRWPYASAPYSPFLFTACVPKLIKVITWLKTDDKNELNWKRGQTCLKDMTSLKETKLHGSNATVGEQAQDSFRCCLTVKVLSPPLVTWPCFAYVFHIRPLSAAQSWQRETLSVHQAPSHG